MALSLSLTLLVGVAILGIFHLIRLFRTWLKMPPGPWGLPFFGYTPWIDPVSPWKTYAALKNKYGPVMSVNICGTPQIILSDWKSITEAYSLTVFNDRPPFLLFEMSNPGQKGISAAGKVWHDNRTFLLRSMRSFGVGRSTLESLVAHEVLSLVDSFKKDVGKPIEIDGRLDVAVLNVVWKIMTGKQTSLDDVKAQDLTRTITKIGNLVNELGPVQFIPILAAVVPKFKAVMEKARKVVPTFTTEFKREIQEHKGTLQENPLHIAQDIVDDYLRERSQKQKTDPETAASFTDDHLMAIITAMFAAGTDTTATTVRHACVLLAEHRDVQERCHQELDTVVGRDHLPSWEADKPRLPYLEATIREIQRVADITPLSVPHSSAHDTEFRGYFIPKGSWIVSNINACHRDPEHWPDPERFDPARFLDEDGKLKKNIPSFLPFGAGKRRCIGENLAIMELFLHISYMLHHFTIEFPDGFVPDLTTNAGDPITRRPAPFQVVFRNR